MLTLPWITGSPYSLYARVRAIVPGGATSWSSPFGFNMRQPDVPRPQQTYPGLLRWTPVEGADAYDVWLIDLPKIVRVFGNVIDQREFYSFHQAEPWISNIRWRIRTVRADVAMSGKSRLNDLPASSFGPWSPVYESVNPPFDVGPLNGFATASDVVATGLSDDSAHRLMPAFVYGGDQGFGGTAAELYRVYVFTDRDCVNRVFTGAVVGSPAYAPRPFGPLTLPKDTGCALEREADVPQRRRPGDDVHRRLRVADPDGVAAAGRADDEPSRRDSVHASAGGADLAGPRDARAERGLDHGHRRTRRSDRPLGHELARRGLLLDGRSGRGHQPGPAPDDRRRRRGGTRRDSVARGRRRGLRDGRRDLGRQPLQPRDGHRHRRCREHARRWRPR